MVRASDLCSRVGADSFRALTEMIWLTMNGVRVALGELNTRETIRGDSDVATLQRLRCRSDTSGVDE
jgi:hypothetical protein